MEPIKTFYVCGGRCELWTDKNNDGNVVCMSNFTNEKLNVCFVFTGDGHPYSGTIEPNSIFGVRIHGVSYKEMIDVEITRMDGSYCFAPNCTEYVYWK